MSEKQTYLDLMNRLSLVSARIRDIRRELDDAKRNTKEAASAVEGHKLDVIIDAGGYASLGKNAEERDIALQVRLRRSAVYGEALARLHYFESQQAGSQRELDDAKTDFDVARTMAALHGEWLKYSVTNTNSNDLDL